MSDYFQTSESEDVLGSLRHLKLSLAQADLDPQAWKWVVLSLFSAVQGAIVCHASGTTQIECLKQHSAEQTLAWLRNLSGPMPDELLASPEVLFKRMNGTFTDFPPYGGVIQTDHQTDKTFRRLKDLRDGLSHFSPKGWSIEKAFIAEAIPPLLKLIAEIQARGWAFRHLEPLGVVGCLVEELLRELPNFRTAMAVSPKGARS